MASLSWGSRSLGSTPSVWNSQWAWYRGHTVQSVWDTLGEEVSTGQMAMSTRHLEWERPGQHVYVGTLSNVMVGPPMRRVCGHLGGRYMSRGGCAEGQVDGLRIDP